MEYYRNLALEGAISDLKTDLVTVHYIEPESREKSLAITKLEEAIHWLEALEKREESEFDEGS